MCGICGIIEHCYIGESGKNNHIAKDVSLMTQKLEHRGPDAADCYIDKHNKMGLGHTRLAIVDPAGGHQPIKSFPDETVVTVVNGEIYNHRSLRMGTLSSYPFQTQSDSEVVIPLFQQMMQSIILGQDYDEAIINMINQIDGIFAFFVYNIEDNTYLLARDPIGVNPLYWMHDSEMRLYFASELKSLVEVQEKHQKEFFANCKFSDIKEMLPGHYISSFDPFKMKRWYSPMWLMEPGVIPKADKNETSEQTLIKYQIDIIELLEKAVVKRMMTDVPFGVLLSGGLDSSVIASMVVEHSKKRIESYETEDAWYPKIHTFSIGLKDSPDLVAAREVAQFLGTIHHEFIFTVNEALEALKHVIYHTETYDITTIRASIPMFLLAKRISKMGIKMVLSGEGSDEIFAGYLYNHWAPTAKALHQESIRKVTNLHKYDCLRSNKSTFAWGLECRVPFLDKSLVDYVMSIDPKFKMIHKAKDSTEEEPKTQFIEKYLLRKGFEKTKPQGLPQSVLWRVKEQFSDGVGKDHILALKALAEEQISNEDFAKAKYVYPFNTPYTKEHYLYRKIFEETFPRKFGNADQCVAHDKSVACSSEIALKWKREWDKNWDPSGHISTK